MKKLIFGTLLAIFALTANAEELAGMIVDRGHQRAGSDYAHYHAENAKHCARDCKRDDRCKAFDFDKVTRICWLKDRVPAMHRNPNIVTGKKPGHDYDYGYGSDKAVTKAEGYCRMQNRDSGATLWENPCHVKQTVGDRGEVFVIRLENGVRYKFEHKSADDWTVKMDNKYARPAKFVDKGSNKGIFKWGDFKLTVWAEGR